MNFFSNIPSSKKMEIQNKLIYLFKFGSTFYMPFGYKPVIKKKDINQLFAKIKVSLLFKLKL